jgi:uncharacterized protein
VSDAVRDTSGGVVLSLHVTPKSRRPGVAGLRGDAVAIRVTAAPEKGKATAEAIERVARWLGLAPSAFTLSSGAGSRSKRLLVAGISASDLRKRIRDGLEGSGGRTG